MSEEGGARVTPAASRRVASRHSKLGPWERGGSRGGSSQFSTAFLCGNRCERGLSPDHAGLNGSPRRTGLLLFLPPPLLLVPRHRRRSCSRSFRRDARCTRDPRSCRDHQSRVFPPEHRHAVTRTIYDLHLISSHLARRGLPPLVFRARVVSRSPPRAFSGVSRRTTPAVSRHVARNPPVSSRRVSRE